MQDTGVPQGNMHLHVSVDACLLHEAVFGADNWICSYRVDEVSCFKGGRPGGCVCIQSARSLLLRLVISEIYMRYVPFS